MYLIQQNTSVHVHSMWAQLAHLDDDPRLRRDYVLIRQLDKARRLWRDYVRRDALGERMNLLPSLDAALRGCNTCTEDRESVTPR
jgi:hypothetical protein